jgi:N-acetylglutamate synthase-like GNAT family acetyltransferase
MANDEMLREMARHRGFRLVKSRRRKPGSGDYGRFGLTDAAGKKCFGFGKTGLTATAEQVESYLRSIESSSWRRSIGAARAAPARKPAKPKMPAADEAAPQPAPRPAKAAPRPRSKSPAKERRSRHAVAPAKPKPPPPKPAPPPPVLKIREAGTSDASAIAGLLRALRPAVSASAARAQLSALLSAGEPPLLADRGEVIGCVAWHVVPTLQHGKLGRITLILVAETDRGQGIGRALLEAAEARMRKAGCKIIEAISDIAIVNAHGFFRSLGYEQASYRFSRPARPR